jgi:hypothetical protein
MYFGAPRKRRHQQDGVFEADPRGGEYCREQLECLTDPLAARKTR